MDKKGWDVDKVNSAIRGVDVTIMKASVTETDTEGGQVEEKGQTFWLTYVMVLMIYMSILMYGTMILRGVCEEKESKVLEVIASSVKPFHFLAGKLFGIGLLGILQFMLWGSVILILQIYGGGAAGAMGTGDDSADILKYIQIPPMTIVYFIIYFVLGFFLYASLYAAVGSAVTSVEESNSMSFPITLLVILGFFFMFATINAPSSMFTKIVSFFPFFTPLIMIARITTVTPPWYEIWLSIFVMIGTIVVVLWGVGKIFRVGILMYGKKPSIKELFKWLKYS